MSAHPWRRWLQPSLSKRLVVAQAVTIGLIWVCWVLFFAYQSARDDESIEPRWVEQRIDMILAIVQHLGDRPAALASTLERVDIFQRGESGTADVPAVRLTMNVWANGRLLFASPGAPGVVPTRLQRQIERVEVDGVEWRTYTKSANDGQVKVTLIRSGDVALNLLSFSGLRMALAPLLVSLPFLLVAAWLSVRLALRPWRQLTTEISQRDNAELAPLSFRARHAELKPLVASINMLLHKIRTAAEREKDFISDAAHELRTPLAALRIYAEGLQARVTTDQQAQYVQGMMASCERAGRLVSQLLRLMRQGAQSHQDASSTLSLADLVQDRLAALAAIADEHDVELEFHSTGASDIRANPEDVMSMFDNLAENAIKYSPRGACVRISVLAGAHTHLLVVADQGPGIPAGYRQRVLGRFFRMPDQPQPGSGLGLAIVDSVCNRYGATLRLDDGVDGKGLCVSVAWPAAARGHA